MNGIPCPAFARYIGIDYSGAETPDSSLKGLRVYSADGTAASREVNAVELVHPPNGLGGRRSNGSKAFDLTRPHPNPPPEGKGTGLLNSTALPREVLPPASPRKYWTRRGIAEWLVGQLVGDMPTLVGIDHGFSFPLRYFETHHLSPDWPEFLEDFQRHWPTDEEFMYVDFIRDGSHGNGQDRTGNARWRRLAEERCGAKSVFHFDVPGSTAKSTHAGIPWLRYIRQQLGRNVHFWPFDGWAIPPGKSAVAEAYPSLWKHLFPREARTPDQHDAYAIAAWLSESDHGGQLSGFLQPALNPAVRTIAEVEGWILGVL